MLARTSLLSPFERYGRAGAEFSWREMISIGSRRETGGAATRSSWRIIRARTRSELAAKIPGTALLSTDRRAARLALGRNTLSIAWRVGSRIASWPGPTRPDRRGGRRRRSAFRRRGTNARATLDETPGATATPVAPATGVHRRGSRHRSTLRSQCSAYRPSGRLAKGCGREMQSVRPRTFRDQLLDAHTHDPVENCARIPSGAFSISPRPLGTRGRETCIDSTARSSGTTK